jgi:hypothetical protein
MFDTMMLYGDFAEAQQSIVGGGYTGDTVQKIVEYIYTDESPIEQQGVSRVTIDDIVRKALTLVEGATY